LLQHVSGRSGKDRREHGIVIRIGCENDDLCVGQLFPDLAAGFDPAPVGQAYVHHNDVWSQALRFDDRLGDAARLPDDLKSFAAREQCA
jgi:hypothetical protein